MTVIEAVKDNLGQLGPGLANAGYRGATSMTTNQLDGLDGPDSALAHVCLVHGTKWYGSHLGHYPTPAREEDPRCIAPVFHCAQHDMTGAVITVDGGQTLSWM